jgi:hypothetical protein
MNSGDGKGRMSEIMGYACTAFWDMDKNEPMIFFDKQHGMCEMHSPKI